MAIPSECIKDKFPFLCTYTFLLSLGFSAEKADKIALYAFGYYTEIYT